MGAYRQFIIHRNKLPCDFKTGVIANAHDATIWTDHATAITHAAMYGGEYGIGFVFTENDPFWFIDIDSCLLSSGEWSDLARQLCQVFAGCAIEISVSGKGLHLFGAGALPQHACKNTTHHLELYHTDRFVALTGNGAIGNAAHVPTDEALAWLVDGYFKPDETVNEPVSGASPEWCGPTDDDELIDLALACVSVSAAFGGKASFRDLWEGRHDALGRCWPAENRAYDASSADAALAQHLAFWTGRDTERIYRLMMRSALRREKWNRDDYMHRTINGACSRQIDVYSRPQSSGTDAAMASLDPIRDAFAGCVYIRDVNRVFIPTGQILRQEAFRVTFGGRSYRLDAAGTKFTKDPWEGFTQCIYERPPTVDSTRFFPSKPVGDIVAIDGVKYLNVYVPIDVPRKVGDATPFFTHLAKVLPVKRDRDILLSYMAACVQHLGTKFQWAPLLQGVEGNGKTLFTRCVAAAIGHRYVHLPPASEISEKFNAWLFNKLFIGVEDIYVPDKRKEVIEILKPMITSDHMARRAMQTDQEMYNVCANFMFNSNHRNAILKTRNDRRFCVLFCAQQCAEDLTRDGMTDAYFSELYKWLRADGYAIVTELLMTMPIAGEFDPSGICQRAPQTSSTDDAIAASLGGVEQEVLEHIAQEQPGFRGGWISSIMLSRMLEKIGADKRLTHAGRREMLERMGYITHPGLLDGRVNNQTAPDGGKPRLFIRADNPICHLRGAAEIADAYRRANELTNINNLYSIVSR